MKKFFSLVLAMTAVLSLAAQPAMALDYIYESEAPGQNFYTSTSDVDEPIENANEITIGADGTVTANTDQNVTEEPIGGLKLNVGEFPEAWGTQTDIAIAANSVFPNALAPTTQMSAVEGYVQYEPYSVASGALPLGNIFTPAQGYPNDYHVTGVASAIQPMHTITSKGAIGKIYVPGQNVTRYVYEGTTQASMRIGGAHFSSTPGWTGNVCIAGHNRGTSQNFAFLYNVKAGDLIYYTTAYGTRAYQVTGITNPATTDVSGLYQDGVNRLTLYTCVKNQPQIKYCVTAVAVG